MIILSSESSSLLGSVAIHKNGQLLSYKEKMRDGSHSDILNQLIDQSLNEANLALPDIDLFNTGLGPGSFTGIRVSFNTMKTFSYIFNKPFSGYDSLLNLAYENLPFVLENIKKNQQDKNSTKIICSMNAFKNMVYIAEYFLDESTQKFSILKPPQVLRVQEIEKFIVSPAFCVGDAFFAYENYFTQKLGPNIFFDKNCHHYPTAKSLGFIAGLENKNFHWSELLPLYLRASEAEENLNGIKYQPL